MKDRTVPIANCSQITPYHISCQITPYHISYTRTISLEFGKAIPRNTVPDFLF